VAHRLPAHQVAVETNSGPHCIPELQKPIESILKETKPTSAAIEMDQAAIRGRWQYELVDF